MNAIVECWAVIEFRVLSADEYRCMLYAVLLEWLLYYWNRVAMQNWAKKAVLVAYILKETYLNWLIS